MIEKLRRWSAARPQGTLLLVVAAALLPFLGKPFNLDDPLFLWAAKQIQNHPGNPYGFLVNWDWTGYPMWKITENPPLDCYYLALAASVLGWSEVALHAAFLLPAAAVILGTHRLARHFCGRPQLAALVTLFTPVFLVSSTTVMCDVMMLAFWVWAVVFWVEGLARDNLRQLAAAGLLIALAEMTKYYAACLVPLLAAYSVADRRPLKRWGQCLLLPLAVLCAYQYVTQAAYGYSLLYRAMDYASFSKNLPGFSKWNNGLIALAFTGGGMATAVFLAPWSWRPRALGALATGTALIAASICFNAGLWKNYRGIPAAGELFVKIQMILWAGGGLWMLALVLADLWTRRDARSLLLALWVGGTFAFGAFCNWTVNARSLLPLAPAAAILIIRRLEQNNSPRPNGTALCLATGAALALLVTWSDYANAVAVRRGTELIRDKYGRAAGTLWFQGHWGFQYYMEAFGARAEDFKHPELQPGDLVFSPEMNTNISPPDPSRATCSDLIATAGPGWLTTWNPRVGAGFYAAAAGPLPFAFGPVPPEKVFVYWIKSPPPAAAKN
jgi:4-amino-4-deoxy-L-arabinose transferase-like glycosyltransferase